MEKSKMSKNVKILIGVVALVVAIIAMVFAYQRLRPKAQEGTKNVEVTVVSKDEATKSYETKTDAESLKQVMDELEAQGFTYGGTESDFGFMVDTVNGETASFEEDGSYWGFFVNGEYANYGIGEQPVADGDKFEIKYTTE